MEFQIGDRVRLNGTPHKGTVITKEKTRGIPGWCYQVTLDKKTTAWHNGGALTKLVRRKKATKMNDKHMTKKEIIEAVTAAIKSMPHGGSFIFGYGCGERFIRSCSGELPDILFLCEQIKIDAFNKQAKKGE